jgi:hypothetical protein
MKLILLTILFVFSFSASANHHILDTTGLSEVEKAELQTQIAKTKAKKNSAPEAPTIEKVSQWVDLGANLGKGLASAAKELGVAANDFITTPVGKITAFIIIYKFIGNDLIHIGVGGLFLLIAGSLWFYTFRRVCIIDKVVTKQELVGTKVLKHKEVIYGDKWNDTKSDTVGFFTIVLIMIIGTSLFVMFVY